MAHIYFVVGVCFLQFISGRNEFDKRDCKYEKY